LRSILPSGAGDGRLHGRLGLGHEQLGRVGGLAQQAGQAGQDQGSRGFLNDRLGHGLLPCAKQLFSFTVEPFAAASNAAAQHQKFHQGRNMLVVHHLNESRSQRILWLLEELGLPYEIRFYERDPQTRLAPPPCWPSTRWASRRC
jgi:hypothetical protein